MVLTSIQFLEILEPRSQLLLVPSPSIAIPSQRNVYDTTKYAELLSNVLQNLSRIPLEIDIQEEKKKKK